LSETRRYRRFTAHQKLELVMASLRDERSIAELCREHQISESLLRRWRDVALDAAAERLAGGQDRSQASMPRTDTPSTIVVAPATMLAVVCTALGLRKFGARP
jgi:transposase-like protein